MPKGALVGRGARADVFEWSNNEVIKIFEAGASMAWAEGEAERTRRVREAGLPVPFVSAVLEYEGRAAIIYEHVRGIPLDEYLVARPALIPEMAQRTAELHARVHGADCSVTLPAEERIRRAIERARDLPEELRVWALHALNGLPKGNSILHMDFHPKNLILTESGFSIIDWDSACTGCRFLDVAQSYLIGTIAKHHVGGLISAESAVAFGEVFRDTYLDRYLEVTGSTLDQVLDWLPLLAAARIRDGFVVERNELIDIVRRAAEAGR